MIRPTALFAAASTVPGPQQSLVATASVFAALFSRHPKDAKRIQAAQDALTRALAGDSTALIYMQQQAGLVPGYGSATQVGKDAFKAALDAYAAQRSTFTQPDTTTPLTQTVADTFGQVRQDVADSVQKVGAGVTTALTDKVSGKKHNAVTIPLTRNQILIVAALAAAILWLRR
jgi:hypothetical protein